MTDDSAGVEPTPEPETPETPAAKKPGRTPVAARVEALEENVSEIKDTLAAIATMMKAQQAVPAETSTPTDEAPEMVVAEWGDGGVYTYSSVHRELTLMMDPGGKVIIDGVVVVKPHVRIDFQEGQYQTESEEVRDYLEGHELFRKGNIVRGVSLRPAPRQVHDGPKTATPAEPRTIHRPDGALSYSK